MRTNAADSTADKEAYFATELTNARNLWGRCCIQIEEASAIYLNRDTLKIVSTNGNFTSAEQSDLMDDYDDEDAIEIFVIDKWNPDDWDGGGATWGSGTAESKIITAVYNQLPTNQRHLAHELGHVMTLCHPAGGTCDAPMVRGAAGSVMEPSGYFADNPDVQPKENCQNVSNPLIQLIISFCCFKPDK